MPRSCRATCFVTNWRLFQPVVGFPPTAAVMCGCSHVPPFAIEPNSAAICIGVTAMLSPIGTLRMAVPYHLSLSSTKPPASPGRSTPVGSRKPSLSIQLPEVRLAQALLGDRDRADVRGVREDLARRPVLDRVRVGVGDRALARLAGVLRVRVADLERRVGRDLALLQRGHERHELERRAGLVEVGDAAQAPLVGVAGAVALRRHAGRGGHGEDAAGARVEHDRGDRLRVPVPERLRDLLLHERLDAVVERELHRLARHRLAHVQDARPVRVARRPVVDLRDRRQAVARAQLVVARELDAREAGAVDADDLGGQAAPRVGAPRLRLRLDRARLDERAERSRSFLMRFHDRRLEAARGEHELRAPAHALLDLGRRDVGVLRERLREGAAIRQARRPHADGDRAVGDREDLPGAVDDRPARRPQRHGHALLRLGGLRERPAVQQLHLHRARGERRRWRC